MTTQQIHDDQEYILNGNKSDAIIELQKIPKDTAKPSGQLKTKVI
jgi:hypothetical protein